MKYAHQNHRDIISYLKMVIVTKKRNNKFLQRCGENIFQYTVCGNISWYSHYGKQYEDSSKNKKIELLYDLEVTLLSIYLKKMEALI